MRRIMGQDTQDIGANAGNLTPFIEKENGKRCRQALPRPSDAELQNEYNYILAENITKKLLEKGLVSVDEFNKIMENNRRTFSPFSLVFRQISLAIWVVLSNIWTTLIERRPRQ